MHNIIYYVFIVVLGSFSKINIDDDVRIVS